MNITGEEREGSSRGGEAGGKEILQKISKNQKVLQGGRKKGVGEILSQIRMSALGNPSFQLKWNFINNKPIKRIFKKKIGLILKYLKSSVKEDKSMDAENL